MSDNVTQPKRYRLPRSHRLGGQNAFKDVFDAVMRKNAGPLSIHSKPNALAHLRFGVSVSRRVGVAVKRNRIKRLLREAFRLLQHDFPAGYDIVCVVKPHETATLAEYQRLLFSAIRASHLQWQRRGKR